jgi:hypothetical protein
LKTLLGTDDLAGKALSLYRERFANIGTSAILERRQPTGLSLAQIPKLLALPWSEHRQLLGCPLNTDAIKRAKSPLAAP